MASTKLSSTSSCEYIVPKKNRKCHLPKIKNEKYCAQHRMNIQGGLNGRKRIPCPRDPSHTIWEDMVEKHVVKCRTGAQPLPEVPWCIENINISLKHEPKRSEINAGKISQNDIIKIVKDLYHGIVSKEPIETCILNSSGVYDRLAELENKKHALQQGSLIGNMENAGFFNENHIIAEFGCGRAELSRYIARARTEKLLEQKHPSQYILIDRSSPRMKFDSKIISDFKDSVKNDEKFIKLCPSCERIKMDIKDLAFNEYPTIKSNSSTPIIAVSKHLCGCATDLTLSCLEKLDNLNGILIALCCRQICSYETYPEIGRNWLASNGINKNEFSALCKLTSWAVCGKRSDMNEQEYREKEQIGLYARCIIDYGRLLAVRNQGMKAKIIVYIDKEISLENHALIAVKEDREMNVNER